MFKCGFWLMFDKIGNGQKTSANAISNKNVSNKNDDIEFEQKIRKKHSIEQEIENEEWNASQQALRNAVGWKDFDEIKNNVWQAMLVLLNRVKCTFRLPLVKKDAIVGNRMSLILLAMLTAMPFEILAALTSIGAFVCFGYASIMTVIKVFISLTGCMLMGFKLPNTSTIVITFALSMFLWLSFGVFRIIGIELNKTRNQVFIFAMFGAMVAVAAIVVPIICNSCSC